MEPGKEELPPLPSEAEAVEVLARMREEHLEYLRDAPKDSPLFRTDHRWADLSGWRARSFIKVPWSFR
jgi:hypothetical protein